MVSYTDSQAPLHGSRWFVDIDTGIDADQFAIWDEKWLERNEELSSLHEFEVILRRRRLVPPLGVEVPFPGLH